jgi:ASC-1-like (ASCH) protein
VYTVSLKEPWFTHIKEGRKTVEGRLNRGLFKNLKINDVVKWTNRENDVMTKIIEIKMHASFGEMLNDNKLSDVLLKPNIDNMYLNISPHKYIIEIILLV